MQMQRFSQIIEIAHTLSGTLVTHVCKEISITNKFKVLTWVVSPATIKMVYYASVHASCTYGVTCNSLIKNLILDKKDYVKIKPKVHVSG